MRGVPSKDVVKRLREEYPAGTRVQLVFMDDPYTKLGAGERGTVSSVDDMGTVHIRWDCGSSLGAVYGADVIKKVSE